MTVYNKSQVKSEVKTNKIEKSVYPWEQNAVEPLAENGVYNGSGLSTDLLVQMRDTGLCIVAQKKHGKTEALKSILEAFMLLNDTRVFIFDPCQHFRHFFNRIAYIEQVDSTFNIDNLDVKDLLFDVELNDIKGRLSAFGQIVQQDYNYKREIKKVNGGYMPYWTIFVTEEAQDQFYSNVMKGKLGEFCRKSVAQGRNFNQAHIITGQRLADIDTSIVGRCRGYLIGALNEDNDLKKIRRVTNETVVTTCQQLQRGQWIYWTGNKDETLRIDFPMFEQKGKPYPYYRPKSNKISIRRLFCP